MAHILFVIVMNATYRIETANWRCHGYPWRNVTQSVFVEKTQD